MKLWQDNRHLLISKPGPAQLPYCLPLFSLSGNQPIPTNNDRLVLILLIFGFVFFFLLWPLRWAWQTLLVSSC